jgi:hypothetical protein
VNVSSGSASQEAGNLAAALHVLRCEKKVAWGARTAVGLPVFSKSGDAVTRLKIIHEAEYSAADTKSMEKFAVSELERMGHRSAQCIEGNRHDGASAESLKIKIFLQAQIHQARSRSSLNAVWLDLITW